MTSNPHAITLELKEPVPEDVDAGADFSVAVTVAAPIGCDLRGALFTVMDAERVLLAGALPALSGDNHDTALITVSAPDQIAEFAWTLVVSAHDLDGSLPFSFKTRPHATSLAVWDNPSPVVIGETFTLKVGAKCTAACVLMGKEIDIDDENGATLTRRALGTTPWPGTTALYWTSVELAAPADEGCFSWTLKFSPAESSLPHGNASAAFSFVAVRPSEHSVSVKVVEKGTAAPVHDAQVRLGVYRTSTDETGLARFAVPAGDHRLLIWKAGYDAPARTIAVNKSEDVQVEASALPKEEPDAYWRR